MATTCSAYTGFAGLRPASVQCVGVLAKSLGWRWQVHAERLIKPMKLTGLSEHLVQAYKVLFTSCHYVLLLRQKCTDGWSNSVPLARHICFANFKIHTHGGNNIP